MSKKYKAIDCGIYDRYELAAMHGSLLNFDLYNGESLTGVIVDLKSQDGAEFMLLKTGERIRLDEIKDFSVLNEYPGS